MPAPKKNKYWQLRSKDGKEPKYNPDELWIKAIEYFEWIENNPLWESVLVAKGIVINKGTKDEKTVYSTTLPKMRAMTIKAFCLFAEICEKTFWNYRNQKDYLQVTTRIEDIIYSQKLEGAAASLLNPNIIARELGLKEQSSVDQKQIIEFKNVSKQFPDE